MLTSINPVGGRQSSSESLEDDTTALLMTLAKYVDRRGLSPEGFAMCYNQGGGERAPACRPAGRPACCPRCWLLCPLQTRRLSALF